jgi:hypothetical protein
MSEAMEIALIGGIFVLVAAVIGALVVVWSQRSTIKHAENRDLITNRNLTYASMISPIFGDMSNMVLYANPEDIDAFLSIHFPCGTQNVSNPILGAMADRLSHYGRDTILTMIAKFRKTANPLAISALQALKITILHLSIHPDKEAEPKYKPYSLSIIDVWKEFLEYSRLDVGYLAKDRLALQHQLFGQQINPATQVEIEKLSRHVIQAAYGALGNRLVLMIFKSLPDPYSISEQEKRIHRYKIESIILNSKNEFLLGRYAIYFEDMIVADYHNRCMMACEKLRNNYALPKVDSTFH